ncbi:DoxX family membrane protein [Pseudodesulfovibrio sp. F-1]|uniref:DoxX family membrane protein n=1 Tax=Pseudodesulfovibrio alkaliphilus TaxID=2661613 RepID=A0A7K1KMJ2_9BACT|nr:MauE/DoxX family redox-associated membrane protein [Pseudodesulfovibrio alkaliphilus]MUM77306.1 DoxX family membrane protein [Pseudodesulfovibrio alkaliphilus]
MTRQTLMTGAYLALRLGLGGAFVYAGVLKLMDPMAFAAAIDGYGLVSWSTAKTLARVLPAVEVVTGAGLVFDIRGALGLVVAQLLVFMGVLAWAMHLGLDVDCGCFGPSGLPPGITPPPPSDGLGETARAMIRDAAMLAAGGLILWLRRILGVRPRPHRRG